MSEASAAPGGEVTPEEQFHTGASIKVATVAALGGFLFGYDSAVINGAVSAIGEVFNVESTTLGFAVASALLGAAAGAMFGGPHRGPHRAAAGHADRRGAVPDQRAGRRVLGERRHAHRLPHHRRPRGRHRLGDRAGLHRRDRAGEPARPARLAAAARHRHRHLRLAARRLHLRHASRAARPRRVGTAGLALDVPRHGHPRHRLRRAVADDPRVAALPHRQPADPARPARS